MCCSMILASCRGRSALKRITGLVQWVLAEAVSTVNVGDCGGLFGGASRAYALDLIGTASTTKAHGRQSCDAGVLVTGFNA